MVKLFFIFIVCVLAIGVFVHLYYRFFVKGFREINIAHLSGLMKKYHLYNNNLEDQLDKEESILKETITDNKKKEKKK